eukprot:5019357-Prymnesium_polylepis.4
MGSSGGRPLSQGGISGSDSMSIRQGGCAHAPRPTTLVGAVWCVFVAAVWCVFVAAVCCVFVAAV